MAIETSLVIRFEDEAAASEADQIVIVELDPTVSTNLDNGNLKSTFGLTATPYFIVHHSPNLTVSSVTPSDGIVYDTNETGIVIQKTEEIIVTDVEDVQSVSYYNPEFNSAKWYGSGCEFNVVGSKLTPLPGGSFPCVGDITFNVTYNKKYYLEPPAVMDLNEDGVYKIVIVVLMALVTEE